MSKEGEMIWEHAYYELKEDGCEAKSGEFFDAVELDEGSIRGQVGGMRSYNQDILIARLDSEGCLMYDCNILNDVTDVLSDVDDVQLESGISVYPNPSVLGKDIMVKIDASSHLGGQYTLQIFNAIGELIQTNLLQVGEQSVQVEKGKGLYFIRIMSGDKTLYSDKHIRL